MNPVKHVAIIMDGNGRWGVKHKIVTFETSSKNKLILNLGLNYVLGSDLISDNDFFAYSFIYNFNVQEIAKDTIEMSNEISSMVIPKKLDIGIAFGKIYKNKSKSAIDNNYYLINNFYVKP